MSSTDKKVFIPGYNPNRDEKKRVATRQKATKARYRQVVKLRAQGLSGPQIQAELKKKGITYSTDHIYDVLKKDDVKAMLEKEYGRLAAAVPRATKNIIDAAESFTPGSDENNKIAWEASKLIAQAHGIIPTSQQSVVHQTFINKQVNALIPPVIAELAAKHFGGMIENNVIDVEAEDAREDDEVQGDS